MKVYTQVGQKDNDQVKPENINDNTRTVISEYNGKLDGQNFPVQTIDKLKLAPSVLTSQSTAKVFAFKHIGQTQDYHYVRRWNTYEGSKTIHQPLVTFDLQAENWSSGWNDLVNIDADYEGVVLQFDAKNGTLSGCFDINFRHGLDVITNSSGTDVAFGQDWWSRWGLFCNDILIAETGRVYPRLANLSVPFKFLVGSQPVRLELKWQTITTNPEDDLGVDTNPSSIMEIYGASIWTCNTKR
jgi:hypothetical protein